MRELIVTQRLVVALDNRPDKQQPSSSLGGWVDPEEVVVCGQSSSFWAAVDAIVLHDNRAWEVPKRLRRLIGV